MTASARENSKTLEQRRARHAWEAVQAAKKREGVHKDQDPKKFGTHVKRLPVRIIASGLGQALAFLKAKNEVPGLLNVLSCWIIQERFESNKEEKVDLLDKLMKEDADYLRFATQEALDYLVWLVRFADAEGLTEDSDKTN